VAHRVLIEKPVVEFIGSLPPETRRLVRDALHRFAAGDWHSTRDWPAFHHHLEGKLARFGRIRAGRIRLVYVEANDQDGPVKRVFYAGWRGSVYDALEQLVVSDALRELGL
jgi:mRNA-degrading endonuclease RelE of RelBE toxin-antitoxin system